MTPPARSHTLRAWLTWGNTREPIAMKTILSFAGLFLILSSSAEANIIRLNPYDRLPAVRGSGWRTESTDQPQYRGGFRTGWTTHDGKPLLSRGYMVFSLQPVLNSTPWNYRVVGAELELSRVTYLSPDAVETLGIFDVTTPVATLESRFDADPAIFSDLGSGVQYAAVTLSAGGNDRMTIPLNADAVRDIRRTQGGLFSLGLSLLTARPSYVAEESLFSSGGWVEFRILIAPVPEPSAIQVAIASLFGLPLLRRHRGLRRWGVR